MEHSSLRADQSEVSLEELVRKAQEGDEWALSILVDRYQKPLYQFCFYLVKNSKIAEDLCQDTFVRVLTNLKKLKNPGKFHSWLFQISKNLFLDQIRSTRFTETLFTEPSSGSNFTEVHLQIVQALAKLDSHERLVLLLVDMQGCSYSEAADILEISVEAVTSRIYRARQEFVKFFDHDERNQGIQSST